MKAMRVLVASFFLVCSLTLGPVCGQEEDRVVKPSASAPSGASLDGLALSLAVDRSTVRRGDPIWATVEVRNVSDGDERLQMPVHSAFDFDIRHVSTGDLVARNKLSTYGLDFVSGPPDGRPLLPGTSFFLRFRLDEMYEITEGGVYRVSVSTSRVMRHRRFVTLPNSNCVELRIIEK